jgi:hypothetical protein
VLAGLQQVELEMGCKLGDAANPLLLSVRSGAAVGGPLLCRVAGALAIHRAAPPT